MNLQLFLGYSYVGSVPIDPEAAIHAGYLQQKRIELETMYKEEIERSKSKPIFYVEGSRQQMLNQKLHTQDPLWSW